LPLDRFFDIGTAGMDELAQMFQDRLRERRGPFYISVNTRISSCHDR
jgi:hypothetical protein